MRNFKNTWMVVAVLSLGSVGAACTNSDDVGDACPMEVPPPTTDNTGITNYPAVYEVNTEFPCDSLTCASTDGRDAYCTRACSTDGNCPTAFTCSNILSVNPNNESESVKTKFCVWRGCRAQLECGDVSKYDCIEGDYGPTSPPGLCGPIKNNNSSGGD